MKTSLLTITLMLAASAAAAQDQTLGAHEFMSNCASCHGREGKGNGPFAELLETAPTDLTQLRAENGGQFPFERVYRVIDGRDALAEHGSREMPVWGAEYNEMAHDALGEFYGFSNPEVFVSGRILSLISYIQDIQE